MNAEGINQGTSGNVSVRVTCGGTNGFLITPSGVAYEQIRPEDIVFVDLRRDGSGYYGEHLPSSEWRMHRDVYLAFPDARAVVHTHSPFATAISAHRRSIPAFHYMVGVAGGKVVPCAEYATFGGQELSDGIVATLAKHGTRACLLANHGVIAHAGNLRSALKVASEVETLAQQYAHARSLGLGEPATLDDAEMDVILAKFQTYGKQAAEIERMDSFARTHAIVPPPKRG
jgi:L-fuculose-phosphate aldolase